MRRRSVLAISAAVLVAAGLVTTAVLAFPVGTVGRASGGPMPLPATLEGQMFGYCLPDTTALVDAIDRARTDGAGDQASPELMSVSTNGSGASFSATVEGTDGWQVEVDRTGVTVSGGAAGTAAAAAPFSQEAIALARQLYLCESQYRFVDESTHEATSSQLVQWYKYDVGVLWPCLAAHGLRVGDPPTREDFSDPFRAQSVDPYQGVKLGERSLAHVLAAVRDCPLRPPFLR